MKDRHYEVVFLIKKHVRVEALDEIQAELEAARKLSKSERRQVESLKVVDLDDEKRGIDYMRVDRAWWDEHGL